YGPASNYYWSCAMKVDKFKAAGVPAAKIGLGVPFYGRRWTGCTQLLQPCTMQGYFSYHDLVSDATRWQASYRHYDTTYKSNYLSIPALNEFDSYNGPEFMTDIVAYAKAQGIGGFL